jgi:hypothetical protein
MFTGNDKKDEIQCKVEDIAGLNHVAKSSLSFSKTENDKSAVVAVVIILVVLRLSFLDPLLLSS